MEVAKEQGICGILENTPYLRWGENTGGYQFVPVDLKTPDAAAYRYSIRFMIEKTDPADQRFYLAALGHGYGYWWMFITAGKEKLQKEQLLVTDNYGPWNLDGETIGTSHLMWGLNAHLYMFQNQMCIGRQTIGYRVQDGTSVITGGTASKQVMRIYEVKVEDYNTGELLRDYIPATEDGVCGLKDDVTGVFCPQYTGAESTMLEYGVEIRKGRKTV